MQCSNNCFLEDGQFVADGRINKLPTRRRAIVNVFVEEIANDTDELLQVNTILQDRVQRIARLLADASNAENDVMTDEDWDEMLTIRSRTNAGLYIGF